MPDSMQPQRLDLRLKSAPRIRQILYCDFPNGSGVYPNCAVSPEIWKSRRPVLIISPKAKLNGCALILPLTSREQPESEACHKMEAPVYGKEAWIICNYLTSISVARLSAPRFPRKIAVCPQADFTQILHKMQIHLPKFTPPSPS